MLRTLQYHIRKMHFANRDITRVVDDNPSQYNAVVRVENIFLYCLFVFGPY